MMINSDSNPIILIKMVVKVSLRAKQLILKCFESLDPKLMTKAFCVFVRPIFEYMLVSSGTPIIRTRFPKSREYSAFSAKEILHNQVYLNCDDFFRARVLIVLEAIQ